MKWYRSLFLLGLVPILAHAEGEWSGSIGIESRLFFDKAEYQGQDDQHASIVFEPEYYFDWQGGDQRLVFNPFFRLDLNDDERTHVDLRELYWRGSFADLEVKAGLVKVFWGVAESQHLVDVINQTDLVENIDGEDKLGQPMVNLSLVKSWGTLDFYLLPYFRERTFPGEEGRLRSRFVVDTDHELYESGADEEHLDVAVRWSHYWGDWDIGIAHFSGTGREPILLPTSANGKILLTPYYQQIEQTSLDLQATKGDWLWKLEAISSRGEEGRYSAFVGGFEYTLVGIADSSADLGLLLEYHFDDRGDYTQSLFQNDIFAGLRWVLNDVQSTELLAGVVVDADTQVTFGNIEASRRLGQSWKISLEARIIANADPFDPLYDLREDSYLEFKLSKYF